MTRDQWASQYRRLLTAFNKNPNAEQAGLYFGALEDLPSLRVEQAVDSLIRTAGHWPTVAAIRETAHEVSAAEWREQQARTPNYTVADPMTPAQVEDFRQQLAAVKRKLGMG